jgi:hypothetical protein
MNAYSILHTGVSRPQRPTDPYRPRAVDASTLAVSDFDGAPASEMVGTTDDQVLTNKCFPGTITVAVVADGAFVAGTVLTVSLTTDDQVTPCDPNVPDNFLRVLGVAATAALGAGSTVKMAVGGEVAVRVNHVNGQAVRG